MNELEVFTAAWELNDTAARASFLDQACAEHPNLRARVEALLRNASEASRYLEPTPSCQQLSVDELVVEQVGSLIGPYKLLEQVGEGGMGVVYRAAQTQPVKRMVALKLIKPGMDTKQVVARFEAERQALAMMNHASIAKVLDAGVTTSGRPYFVMELVNGLPITEFCDQHKLDTRQRLQLFATTCQAIQHAHQKGVIHRDLKPSNVLVEMHDVAPVPKVIDFGVAKAIGQRLTEKSLHTGFSQLVGTPLYMSPEQAGQSSIDVDTRSDVYSLGVLLYEILTGHTPFQSETLRNAGLDEMRRMIREDEPPRPSARVSTLQAQALSTISDCRQADPRKLSQQLRGELDWIVMKALDKDRTRRYESASAFAADIERYLSDEPVHACPPSTTYRLGKFARRHRAAFMSVSLATVALLVGSGVSIWQAVEANSARKSANDNLVLANKRLILADERLASEVVARGDANRESQRAAENFQTALAAVDQMLTRVGDERLSHIAGAELVRKDLLNDALRFYREFLAQNSSHPVLRFEIAQAWRRVGQIYQLLGEYVDARNALEHSIQIAETLAQMNNPPDARHLELLSESYLALGTLSVMNLPLNAQDASSLNRALETRRLLQQQDPGEKMHVVKRCEIQRKLAAAYRSLGRTKESQDLIVQTIGLLREWQNSWPDDFGIQLALCASLTEWAQSLGNPDETDKAIAEAVRIGESLLPSAQDHPVVRETLALALVNQGDLMRRRRRWSEAEASYRKLIVVFDPLIATQTRIASVSFYWCWSQLQLAEIYVHTQRPQDAARAYEQAWNVLVPACRQSHGGSKLLTFLNLSAEGWGNSLIDAGRIGEAISVHREVLLVLEQQRSADVVDGNLDDRIRNSRCRLAELLSRNSDLAEAEVQWKQVLAEFGAWQPKNAGPRQVLYPKALVHLLLHDRQAYRRACERMMAQSAGVQRFDRQWSNAVWTCVVGPDAVDDYSPIIELAQEAHRRVPNSQPVALDLGAALFRAGRFEEAVPALNAADTPDAAIARVWYFLSLTHHALGNAIEARDWFNKAEYSTQQILAGTKLEDGTNLTWERSVELQLLRAESRARLDED